MTNFFTLCLGLALLAVLATLGLGLFSMIKGGEFARKHANRLMRARVILQGAALALFILAFLTAKA